MRGSYGPVADTGLAQHTGETVGSSSRPMSGVPNGFCGTDESWYPPLTALVGHTRRSMSARFADTRPAGPGVGWSAGWAAAGARAGPGSYSSDVSKFQNQASPGS